MTCSLRHKIRTMIDGETASDILSDDQIVDQLCADGIDIARRTVAKYREAMGVPPASMRKARGPAGA